MLLHELKKIIKTASEQEVKTLLFQIFLRAEMEKENNLSPDTFTQDIIKMYKDYVKVKQAEKRVEDRKYKACHILFGHSAAGSMKMALKELNSGQEEQIICFADLFSVWPIWQLHAAEGLRKRQEWLQDHINFEESFFEQYETDFNETLDKLGAIAEDTPIFIWAGDNAHEQIGARFVLFQLRDKQNDIKIINVNAIYPKLFAKPNYEFTPLHTGEIIHEKLAVMYQNSEEIAALTAEEKEKAAEEWKSLAAATENLRIWEKGQVCAVNEDFFDANIMSAAKCLQNKRNEFKPVARLIGEVIGHLEQYVGDGFLEYRVRQLIYDGKLDIKGVPKAMRHYRVRLRESKE